MFQKLKIKLGISDHGSDELMQTYLDDAINYAKGYCNTDVITEKLETAVVEIATIFYNKNGVEGQISHSEGGISRSYTDDLPRYIVKLLNSERKLP